MTAMRAKLSIAAAILVTTVVYLAYAGVNSGGWVYYLDVDQFAGDTQYHSQRVRLHGVVGSEGFAVQSGSLSANFVLQAQDPRIPRNPRNQPLTVAYRGIVPDMFKVGGEVVVEGKLDGAGIFQADKLLTKCASKYDPATPHAKEAGAL